ncbi:MAG TPA: hypothetical protein VJJ22_05020 [Candidatus Paceibacterota bacterium]
MPRHCGFGPEAQARWKRITETMDIIRECAAGDLRRFDEVRETPDLVDLISRTIHISTEQAECYRDLWKRTSDKRITAPPMSLAK